jgi:hypothetical protein
LKGAAVQGFAVEDLQLPGAGRGLSVEGGQRIVGDPGQAIVRRTGKRSSQIVHREVKIVRASTLAIDDGHVGTRRTDQVELEILHERVCAGE